MSRPTVFRPAVLALGVTLALLAGCQTEAPSGDLGLSNFAPEQMEKTRARCLAEGGSWGQGGKAGMTCLRPAPDAGKSCSGPSQCSGNICLARSRTCAPVTPLFGCNEVLTAAGRPETLCID